MKGAVELLLWFYDQRPGTESPVQEANNDVCLAAYPSRTWLMNCSQGEAKSSLSSFVRTSRRMVSRGDCKGIPARRERIEAAVEAGGKHVKEPYEGSIASDPFRGGVRVVITGAHGFERAVLFALDEDPTVITQRVRETIEE